MRVLVGSSDDRRRDRVVAVLAGAGHTALTAPAAVVLAQAERDRFELVILDLGEPDVDVLALCARLRAARPALAILVLTPDDDVDARVRSLRAGADDSLSEPFAPSQMAARVDALARRTRLCPADPEIIEEDGCRIDLRALRADRDGAAVALTAREVAIVAWLHRHRGRVVSRAELLAGVWGVAPTLATRTVDVTIAKLRKKVERDPGRPRLVVGVKAAGYAWGDPRAAFTQD